ncbi:MAG: type II toxin-antitoxin system HicA family toxin [Bacteroidota bacterium]
MQSGCDNQGVYLNFHSQNASGDVCPGESRFSPSTPKGNHVQFKRGNLLVTVPNHPGDLNPQAMRSILRQSQMTQEEFLALLK